MFLNIKQIQYQITIILISFSESIENTILVWLVYNYTKSSIAVSLITFANYFPMFISIITLIFIIDSINPIYQYYLNNILFLIISLGIFLIFSLNININLCLFLVFILQMIYSTIRTINKTNSNKIIKLLFKKNIGNKVIQISFSITQIFQTLGNFIANIFILKNITLYGFTFINIFYLISSLLSFNIYKNNKKYLLKINKKKNKNNKSNSNWIKHIFNNKKLLETLFFSIPSSGIYQYLITILPFLTTLVIYKSSLVYSILNFFCALSSSIIGFLLYKDIISRKFIEKYTFILCFLFLSILSVTKNFFILILLNSLCFGLLSGHIICMQIKINTYTSYFNLGKFTIIRNSIASLSKILFSFLSVFFLKNFSIFYVYLFLAFISLFFQFIYIIYFNKKKKNNNLINK